MSSEDTSIHRNILRVQEKADVFKKYEVTEVMGQGSMGAVSKVRIKENKIGGSAFEPKTKGVFKHIKKKLSKPKEPVQRPASSGEHLYALKSIILDRVSPVFLEELKNEIEILRWMDHPNVVKAHEVFLCKNKQIYIVLELCDGGDLYTHSPYSEKHAARIVNQLTSAISYMHSHKIVHRDLKFENIMFADKSETSDIKVIDFGLSKKFLGQPGFMTDRVGTIYTMAPQVLQGIYSSQADLWSTGVISFMLLSASKPFYAKKRRKMIDLIMRGKFSYKSMVWDAISDDAKDFCSKLLLVDPKHRMAAADAIKHPWLVNREQLPDDLPSEEVLASIEDSLMNYKQTSHLKKLALTMIAHKSTTKEIIELRKAFAHFDTTGDGIVSFDEFKTALERMHYSEPELEEIFSSIDLNQNGHIMYTEFLSATIEAHGHIEEDRIAEAFDRLDSDDTGYISKENLKEALGKDCNPAEVKSIIETADKNKDGRISYDEFLLSFREQQHKIARGMERTDSVSTSASNSEPLLGLDAKIPGGRYDSGLSSSLQEQIKEM